MSPNGPTEDPPVSERRSRVAAVQNASQMRREARPGAVLGPFEARVTSQNGEDGVIAELVRRVGAPGEWFVEFGAERGQEGNCRALADAGWHGLFMEADDEAYAELEATWSENAHVATRHAAVHPHTLEALLDDAGVPPEPDVFSIDIDSNDFHVWSALRRYRPRIVVIEYNGDLPLDRRLVMPLDLEHRWDGTDYYGASLGAYEQLGREKGYVLVHTESAGVNAFFVRDDLLDGSDLPTGAPVSRHGPNHFGSGHGHPADPEDRPWIDLAAGDDGATVRRSELRDGARRGLRLEPPPALPPAHLVGRVVPPATADRVGTMLASYREGGRRTVIDFDRALTSVGREMRDYRRMLDFGCGPGRTLGWLGRVAADVELHGTDIDPDAIEWARRELPFADFAVAPHEPPIPYPDAHFDLVLNHSVFTHLDEARQDQWLAELRRVTEPGGVVLLTLHGPAVWSANATQLEMSGLDADHYRRRFASDGILFFEDDMNLGSSHPDFYRTTFHAPWYVFEHWAAYFAIEAYLPHASGPQDMVVLRRRYDDEPVPPTTVRPRVVTEAQPASTPPEEGAALSVVEALLHDWPAPQTPWGRLKARVLRSERDRLERLAAALAQAVRDAEADAERPHRYERLLSMLPHVIAQQGERITMLERGRDAEPRP